MNSNEVISNILNSTEKIAELSAQDLSIVSTSSTSSSANETSTVLECNECKREIFSGYTCNTCTHSYRLCNQCFDTDKHEHKLDTFSNVTSTTTETQTKKNQNLVEFYLKALHHSVSCNESNCRVEKCSQIKRIIQHSNNCQELKNGTQCEYCRQLIALCIYHAKACEEDLCQVPHCLPIKLKICKQQEFKIKLQSATEFIMSNLKLLNHKLCHESQTQTDSEQIEEHRLVDQDEIEDERKKFLQKIEQIKNATISSREEKIYKFDRKLRNHLVKSLIDNLMESFELKSRKFFENSHFASVVVLFIKNEKQLYAKTNNSDDYLCLMSELLHKTDSAFRKRVYSEKRLDVDTQVDLEDVKKQEESEQDQDLPPRKKAKLE